jgi:hypothetical protein
MTRPDQLLVRGTGGWGENATESCQDPPAAATARVQVIGVAMLFAILNWNISKNQI